MAILLGLRGVRILENKIFDEEIRNWMKYYGNIIRSQLEWVEGLEKYDIDNEELDNHYSLIMDGIYGLHRKLEKYCNKI